MSLQIKPANECRFDQISLGEVMLRLDPGDLPTALWRFCNNLDPKRDHIIVDHCIGFDGTRKTKELDDFQRDWPNIIVADERTINVHISHIRDKIEPDPAQPRFIKTVRGVGYAFSED